MKAYEDIGMRVSYCYAVREQNRFVYEADQDFCKRLPPDVANVMADHFAKQSMEFDDFMQLLDVLVAQNRNPSAQIQLAPRTCIG